MAEISSEQIDELQRAMGQPERIIDGALLAGGVLVTPLLALRRRQARMEAIRTERRLGPDHDETRARQAAVRSWTQRESDLRKEVERQKLPRPAGSEQASLYGKVLRRDQAVAGVIIAALDEQGASLTHSCTGIDGEYSLSFKPDTPVRIEVRDERQRLFRDENPAEYPPWRATYRDVELSRAKPPCPDEPPAPPGEQLQMPRLIGMREERAMETLKALGLKLGKRTTRRGREAGIVLDHDPGPAKPVKAGAAVDIVVSSGADRPALRVPDLTGRSLHQAIAEIGNAGAELGRVSVTTDGGRTPLVRAARPDDKGERVDLDISTTGGDAQLMSVTAAVLAATAEGRDMELDSAPAAAEWLKRHRLTSLDMVRDVQTLDDAGLRKRLRLKGDAPVGPIRALLLSAVDRVQRS